MVVIGKGLLENHLSDGTDKTVLHGIEFVYDKPFIVMILDFLITRYFFLYQRPNQTLQKLPKEEAVVALSDSVFYAQLL